VIANLLTQQLKLIEKAIFDAHIPSSYQIQDVFA
jgi:hypothetical protein